MRAVFFCLLGALVLSSGAAAQVVINEVYTGTPDYVELRNLGAAPVDVSGWTVQTFETASTSGGTPSAEPVYTIPAGTIIASQEQLLLEENGTANAAGTLGPCAIRTGFNYNWTNTRSVEVLLRDNTSAVMDYVYRRNGAAAGTPNANGATFTGTLSALGNVISRNGDTDNDTAADWTVNESTTPCAANAGQAVPPPPYDLNVTTTGAGDVSIAIDSTPALPGAEFFNVISTTIYDPVGSGPLFGVGLDGLFVFQFPAAPGNPVHSFLDGNGEFTLGYGAGTIPGGVRIQVVSIAIRSDGSVAVSDVNDVTF